MAVLKIKTFPTPCTRSFRLEQGVSIVQSHRKSRISSAMRLRHQNRFRFSISRAWAKKTGEELIPRIILRKNERHGMDE